MAFRILVAVSLRPSSHKNKLPMLRKPILITVFLFSTTVLFGQADSADKYGRNLKELTQRKKGPNLDYYGHPFIGYGFIAGESNDSAQLKYGKSSAFNLGYLWKWRMAKWLEIGFDMQYHYSSFHLEQDSSKIVPNRLLHKREKIVFNSVQVAPFTRLKIRNRHHSTGTFVDFGGYAGVNYRIKNQTVERNQTPGAGKTKTVNVDLEYTERVEYGLLARIGFNRFVFYGRYRLSSLFTEDSDLPDLPNLEIGLRVGIHQ